MLRCNLLDYSLIFCAAIFCLGTMDAQTDVKAVAISSNSGLQPNLIGHVGRPLRYRPEHGDFVIVNGAEYFNRSLYGGNTAFRVDGGDKPEFTMYLPGRGGNLRLGVSAQGKSKWLKDASHITTRYRPGELMYEIEDQAFGRDSLVTVDVLAYARTEGLIVRVRGKNIFGDAQLIWAYGGVNGQRGSRDGDIGTERVPISQYFQFQPAFAEGNVFTLGREGFSLRSSHATIAGTVPSGGIQHVADAEDWNDLSALMSDSTEAPKRPVIVGRAPFSAERPLLLSLQRVDDGSAVAVDLDTYRDVTTSRGKAHPLTPEKLLPVFKRTSLPAEFATAEKHFQDLRSRVLIQTPDPYLDAAMASLNVVADALWDADAHAIMHGAIAWRTKLLGWRGPYALDALGWHDRARENFETWIPDQNREPIPPELPAADPKANLARNEPGLHSNGDLSHSHYDMNMVFIDALMRHLLWTGDVAFARDVWPVIERHLAWERRLFRREYGPGKLPLYEAYATIWASDDLYYNGGGTAYASAYNVYANRMAARIARLVGKDPEPYAVEADLIERGMRALLWLPEEGTFAEYKDILGKQLVHADYGLWNFYHTVDEEAVTPREAWEMGTALESHMKAIPVEGPDVPRDQPYHVFSETDWMPYSWSINNVVMDENMHTALALWQGGHSKEAYVLAKGSLLASMYMGISPGNVGTMDYLDVYRRESQRDFGDSAGTMSRAIVEGLFGVHPDALAGMLTIAPGFPDDWTHARMVHPDVTVDFVRTGRTETWEITQSGKRFQTMTFQVPAAFTSIASVQVNGKSVRWLMDPEAAGRPVLKVLTKEGASTRIRIEWSGDPMNAQWMARATPGETIGNFRQMSNGRFRWWNPIPFTTKRPMAATEIVDWHAPIPASRLEAVDLDPFFNDRVSAIFAMGKYLTPRSSGVSLELPWQGAGAWAGHLNTLPAIDDSGLRKAAAASGGRIALPNGVFFATPPVADVKNIIFTSQWSNYPHEVSVPLSGHAAHAFFLMAGSTNFMQSRMDNGEVVVTYTDGGSTRLALRNPETWWPIEQDYFIDDYQFPMVGPLPPRVDLKTGNIRVLSLPTFKGEGRDIPGGAATVLDLALDPKKQLQSVTVRTLTNDSIVGLMSVTLERP
jgi:hypothetical protein